MKNYFSFFFSFYVFNFSIKNKKKCLFFKNKNEFFHEKNKECIKIITTFLKNQNCFFYYKKSIEDSIRERDNL